MGKEDGDDRVMAQEAGGVKGSRGTNHFILPIDIEREILPENILHFFHFSIPDGGVECLLHYSGNRSRKEKKNEQFLFLFFSVFFPSHHDPIAGGGAAAAVREGLQEEEWGVMMKEKEK